MVLPDFGAELGWDAPVEVREDVLRTFARLQVRAAPQVDRLLAAGCLDRRLAWLSAQAEGWLPAVQETGRLAGIDAATWLSAGEVAELAAAGPRLAAMCGELAAFAVPATLLHGDLHLSNVAKGPAGYLFFDWSDACVAHPFLDMIMVFHEEDGALREPAARRLPRRVDPLRAARPAAAGVGAGRAPGRAAPRGQLPLDRGQPRSADRPAHDAVHRLLAPQGDRRVAAAALVTLDTPSPAHQGGRIGVGGPPRGTDVRDRRTREGTSR